MLSLNVLQTRDVATYSCTWGKHGSERFSPMALHIWPCTLLLDMLKHGLQENWRRENCVFFRYFVYIFFNTCI